MKVVLQRVKSASVSVDGKLVSSIGKGVLAFAAVDKDDTMEDTLKSAAKLLRVKLWDDDDGGRWKKSVQDVAGEVLCVSQFTLLAGTKKAKPDFHKAAGADKGKELYSAFFKKVQELYEKEKVKDGIFQAMMDVALVNDGPVGVDYTSEHEVVTLHFDTNPGPLNIPSNPSSSSVRRNVTLEDLGQSFQNLQAEFSYPPELLE